MEGYGATECGCPVWQFPGEEYPAGSCGRSHPDFEILIVDDRDRPLSAGEAGEIVVRPRRPGLVMEGYYQDAQTNQRTFRIPGAVCMGDQGRLDEQGNLYFLGRGLESIRRRGENISIAEVEEVLHTHPAILEAAVFGLPHPEGEQEVAATVVFMPGQELKTSELQQWCSGRMARHTVPSAWSFTDRLPRTPTQKIARHRLVEMHQSSDGK